MQDALNGNAVMSRRKKEAATPRGPRCGKEVIKCFKQLGFYDLITLQVSVWPERLKFFEKFIIKIFESLCFLVPL